MVNVVCWYYETSFLMMEHLHPNLGQSDKNLFFAFTLENWFNACIFLMHAFVFACGPHITNWLLCEVTLSCSAHPFLTLYFPFYFPIHASVGSGPIRSILLSCSVSSNFPTSFIRWGGWGRWGSGERKSPFCKAQRWHSSSSSSSS